MTERSQWATSLSYIFDCIERRNLTEIGLLRQKNISFRQNLLLREELLWKIMDVILLAEVAIDQGDLLYHSAFF